MNWWRKVFGAHATPAPALMESSHAELLREQRLRRVEKIRTERLARLLSDYQKQDENLRR